MSDLQPDPAKEMEKTRLRAEAQSRRAALSADERAAFSQAAATHLLRFLDGDRDKAIALYWPIRDEIDSKPVLIHLMDEGYRVGLPVVTGDGAPLQFRLWEPGAQLYEAGFGTLAPAETAPALEPDIVIIPLLGFDKTGSRLGYGKGYYDRTLAVLDKKPELVGFAFSAQELDYVPRAPHDVPLDRAVTEAGVRTFA